MLQLNVTQSVHQQRVNEFMSKAGQALPPIPAVPDVKTMKLRLILLFEELLELADAMGMSVHAISCSGSSRCEEASCKDGQSVRVKSTKNLRFDQDSEPDLIEIADALADISVVNTGTMSAFGINDLPILEEVDQNNLDKFAEGHYVDDNGKLHKPPNHKRPDFRSLLVYQGWADE